MTATATPKPIWRAGQDRVSHALAKWNSRRYACGDRVLDERFAWPAERRCERCVVALAVTACTYPDDRYLVAIAARNIQWARYAKAHAAWLAAGAPIGELLAAVNATQHDYEWSERDLVRARVLWRSERAADVTSRGNCPLCRSGQPGRHPDRGGTHAAQVA